MRVLVTGGAGFIGRWVCSSFLALGGEVIAFDDLSNGSEENVLDFQETKAFQLKRGDVSTRSSFMRGFDERIDLCIHLAAVVEVQKSIDDPSRTYEVNVNGMSNVLEACRRWDARLTVVSTCMVYDAARSTDGIGENYPVKPASPYAATKLAADYLALAFHRTYGLAVSVVRPFNTYGPFQKSNQEGGVVAVFMRRALEGEPLQVFGDGEQTRDLMYVDDCVDLIVRASQKREAIGEIINGGTGQDLTINELARIVAGPQGEVKHVPHLHPQSEIRKLRCDHSKATALLGWKPQVPLLQGLARLREWIAS